MILKLFIKEEGKLGGRVMSSSYKDKCHKMDGEIRIIFFKPRSDRNLDLVEHDLFLFL